jgi:serine/threonine protein kinase
VPQYELCMGKHPISAQNEGALIRKIIRGEYERPTGYSRDLLSLITACLTYDHKKRPSAATLLARPVVQKKAHDMHILPLAPARRPSVQQHAVARPSQLHESGHRKAAAPEGVTHTAPDEIPAMIQEKHPFSREGNDVKVTLTQIAIQWNPWWVSPELQRILV